jgi:hypothetical protein
VRLCSKIGVEGLLNDSLMASSKPSKFHCFSFYFPFFSTSTIFLFFLGVPFISLILLSILYFIFSLVLRFPSVGFYFFSAQTVSL